MSENPVASETPDRRSACFVFLIFLRLGLSSFGGPLPHLAYFREEFVTRRRWLSDSSYAELLALCQFLPGPASSQVGMALGLSRAGYAGALAAWAGFTLPSAVLLVLFALGLSSWGGAFPAGLLHGLKVVAVAVVAQAVWGMARNLCRGPMQLAMAGLSTTGLLLWHGAWGQIAVIGAGALLGLLLLRPARAAADEPLPIAVSRRTGALLLGLFFALLLGLPLIELIRPNPLLTLLADFYRAGALVFGGGHVVLPLLQSALVPGGLVSNDTFLAGYGAAQAVPGPLFTFAAFLGASTTLALNPWLGAALCLGSVFLPSFLLVAGALPYWATLRRSMHTQAALAGINAVVVGLLLAALYKPVWVSAIFTAADFGLAALALAALMFWKLPSWLVVLGCGLAGWTLSLLA